MMGSNHLRLRDYRGADFESMWRLDQECFPPGVAYSKSQLRRFLAAKTAEAIVVESDGRIVAFVLGSRGRRPEGHVITLDVTTPARRQGLARRLMVELEGRLRAAGVQRVQLETATTNAVAIGFYERLGYRKIGQVRSYYGPGRHAWRMRKSLESSVPATETSPRAPGAVVGRHHEGQG